MLKAVVEFGGKKMLVQFTVENYGSFREATTFSLRATADTRHPDHVTTNPDGVGGKSLDVLRGAAIYGANGAGKSMLVEAMWFAQRLIMEGTRRDSKIIAPLFKLDAACAGKPHRFEFIFRHEDVLWSYGFAVDAARVHEEWLFATPEKREVRLFERVTDAQGKVTVESGPAFRRSVGASRIEFLAEGTRANQLFLTECGERSIEAVEPVWNWFERTLNVLQAESRLESLPLAMRVNESLTHFLTEFLKAAGTGIEAVEIEEIPLRLDLLESVSKVRLEPSGGA